MALTERQRRSLYDILEMPMFTTVNVLVDSDNLNATPVSVEANSNRNAIEQLEAHLLDIATNYASLETELKVYLDRWYDLGTDQTKIEIGGVGSISGIVIDPDEERMRIKRAVYPIVPFYRHHKQVSLNAKDDINMGVMR